MVQKSILVADDDASIRSLLKQLLTDEGYSISEAATGTEVVSQVGESSPDLVIMDVRMPELDGIEALPKVKTASPKTSVLIMTAFGSSNAAIKAMELGAFDYITKPFELDKISHTVKRAFDYQDLAQEVEVLRDEISSLVQTERIVGNSPPMQEVYKTVGKVAKADATVLITGESGTGKELVAEALHYNSNRRSGPMVKVSCAALPETLLEAELFGHEKGSFTGAMTMRKGRFELADKGTVFLDEIGEMSLATQTKLLRVLQERKIERVGSSLPIKVDIRVICATNKDLHPHAAAARAQGGHSRARRALPREAPLQRDRAAGRDQRGGAQASHGVRLAGQRARARERGRARGGPLARPDHHEPRAAVRGARGRRARG
jgi:two-component system response regulator AtoC